MDADFVKANHRPGGLDETEAMAIIGPWLKKQAALHDPDQIAGGNPKGLTDLGSGRLNSSIGSQWGKGRADELDAGINSRLKKVPQPLWKNITIKTNKGGVNLKV